MRTMKVYGVTEGEMLSLGLLNAASSTLFGFAAFCASTWFGTYTELFWSSGLDEAARKVRDFILTASLSLAIVAALAGLAMAFWRHNKFHAIKADAQEITIGNVEERTAA